MIEGREYEFSEDPLGRDLADILQARASSIQQILLAGHSGKQFYRDLVAKWKDIAISHRLEENDGAAKETTASIYIPVAQALSDKFGEKVGYILRAA